jgi:hypothetical protein
MTLPDPTPEQRAIGWQVHCNYLEQIARMVGKDWARPDWETVQYVLLAHVQCSNDGTMVAVTNKKPQQTESAGGQE